MHTSAQRVRREYNKQASKLASKQEAFHTWLGIAISSPNIAITSLGCWECLPQRPSDHGCLFTTLCNVLTECQILSRTNCQITKRRHKWDKSHQTMFESWITSVLSLLYQTSKMILGSIHTFRYTNKMKYQFGLTTHVSNIAYGCIHQSMHADVGGMGMHSGCTRVRNGWDGSTTSKHPS